MKVAEPLPMHLQPSQVGEKEFNKITVRRWCWTLIWCYLIFVNGAIT